MFSGNNNNCTDNIIYKEEELLEEKKFVLKYSERNYEIKIQLVKINDVHYIRITAQEEKVIINYIYLTEMNEDDFIKQNNKILKLYDNIQEIFVNKLETENKNLNFKNNIKNDFRIYKI
ncbi:hypothetical protein LY90DRAFT_672214 [Neocallimastix californiae]|uniref:Uncharacterized protein n=1 Tax=Neocallimastix californiae TaxID=1754190 RepID=A0A1Y2BZT9_9FUNG|nr:hypothetical protein LY90DRAFT_672214 [Neocallimastix californiae]|eukprot:ORY40302.1 hypothetical protein LY90DRAFT_672214 [Neocallimastix californiae]